MQNADISQSDLHDGLTSTPFWITGSLEYKESAMHNCNCSGNHFPVRQGHSGKYRDRTEPRDTNSGMARLAEEG